MCSSGNFFFFTELTNFDIAGYGYIKSRNYENTLP